MLLLVRHVFMRVSLCAYTTFFGILILTTISFFWDAPVLMLEAYIGEERVLGALIFCVIMIIATVIAPITVFPVIPMIAPVLGPFTTGLMSVIGWTVGAVIAFLIARHAGRPVLSKFVSLSTLHQYEALVPKEARFLTIVLLRMMVPVDVLSYALGFLSTVGLVEYTLATLVGVAYFSFAFSYLGEAALEQNSELMVILGTASVSVFAFSWWYIARTLRRK